MSHYTSNWVDSNQLDHTWRLTLSVGCRLKAWNRRFRLPLYAHGKCGTLKTSTALIATNLLLCDPHEGHAQAMNVLGCFEPVPYPITAVLVSFTTASQKINPYSNVVQWQGEGQEGRSAFQKGGVSSGPQGLLGPPWAFLGFPGPFLGFLGFPGLPWAFPGPQGSRYPTLAGLPVCLRRTCVRSSEVSIADGVGG